MKTNFKFQISNFKFKIKLVFLVLNYWKLEIGNYWKFHGRVVFFDVY